MDEIRNVIQGPMTKDGKWYHCPNCKATFNFMDVLDQIVAKAIDTHKRVYRCNECEKPFRMPE